MCLSTPAPRPVQRSRERCCYDYGQHAGQPDGHDHAEKERLPLWRAPEAGRSHAGDLHGGKWSGGWASTSLRDGLGQTVTCDDHPVIEARRRRGGDDEATNGRETLLEDLAVAGGPPVRARDGDADIRRLVRPLDDIETGEVNGSVADDTDAHAHASRR